MKYLKDIKDWQELKNQVVVGDCLEGMKRLPDNSVDAIVTDPPYGLSFMGKKWDYDVPSKEIWKEALRVLKPGGHLLSFAGSRTYHRMAVNIEDGGFEIRDQIMWVYGSGFPKSLNIGKAVDKLQGNEREVVGKKHNTYDGSVRNPDNHKSPAELSNIGKWGLSKTPHGMNETKGTSQWEGWGTALKPAHEPIVVARKPLSEKSVAENVLKWGTGGINIDGCRVATDELTPRNNNNTETLLKKGFEGEAKTIEPSPFGRFPANLIHDGSDEVVGLFPDTKSGVKTGEYKGFGTTGIYGEDGLSEAPCYADKGSASRFFYCAKASKKDRNEGCEGLEEKEAPASARSKPAEGRENALGKPRANFHPTVKPTQLMQYLVRLVTPKGGTVLDPFMGSGSTGKACKLEGFDFIGIEMDEEYCKIASARIRNSEKGKIGEKRLEQEVLF